jgi:hypothetical protein
MSRGAASGGFNWEAKNTDRIVAGNEPACPAEGGFCKNHYSPAGGTPTRIEHLP